MHGLWLTGDCVCSWWVCQDGRTVSFACLDTENIMGRSCLLAEEKLFPLERKWGSRTAPGHSQEFS